MSHPTVPISYTFILVFLLAVFTSAFESGVAHVHVAIIAAVFGGASVAHGLSTFERLADDTLRPPLAQLATGDLVSVRTLQLALDATADAAAAGEI